MLREISEKLALYLSRHFQEAEVSALERVHGGASRETYRFRLRFREKGEGVAGGARRERRLILRRQPVGSLIETEARAEYAAYQIFQKSDVPVPEVLFLEEAGGILERPFFIMEEVSGCESASPFVSDPYGGARERIGRRFWEILGKISADEARALRFAERMPSPKREECWRRELDYWEGVIDEDEVEPNPIVRAAIRRLRREPPPPPERIALVHGDYRTGNFLFNAAGEICAILDWEMAHLGDPLEDVAWALDALWAFDDAARPGGMIPTDEALAIWREVSGIGVKGGALRWWRIFAAVKGVAIWTSSAKEFGEGANRDPVLALSGWYTLARHNRILLSLLDGGGEVSGVA